MASMTTRLLLIDDHALFRSGVGLVLAAGLGDIEICEAASLEQALQFPNESFDLLLVDIQLEGLSGLDGITLLKHRWPGAKVLVVSALQDSRVQRQALERGAQGFISKTETPVRMLEQVSQVLGGQSADALTGVPAPSGNPTRLSPRQTEVLELLGEGLPNKLIGRRLNLSENTVRGHVQAILLALKVSSRSEAAFVARRLGLLR